MMLRISPVLLFYIALIACSCGYSKRPINRDKLNTRMTQDAYLYFRNLRQTNYRIEEMPEAGIRMYWHKKQAELDSSSAMLNLGILANWKSDQAYIILQPSPLLGDSIQIKWQNEVGESGELLLAKRNKHNQLAFIADLYDLINQEAQFVLMDSSLQSTFFLQNEQELEVVHITLKDYFKLIGVL